MKPREDDVRMSDTPVYTKVTVIVEERDGTVTTMKFHKTTDIKVERLIPQDPDYNPYRDYTKLPTFIDMMEFNIDFTAFYDHKASSIATTTVDKRSQIK